MCAAQMSVSGHREELCKRVIVCSRYVPSNITNIIIILFTHFFNYLLDLCIFKEALS
jgi:hypothetical protein